MAAPLPVTQIFAYRGPIVNGREVTVPVQVHGEWAGLRGDVSVMRRLAHDLLGATVPVAKRVRRPAPPAMADAPRERCPLLKPKGSIV